MTIGVSKPTSLRKILRLFLVYELLRPGEILGLSPRAHRFSPANQLATKSSRRAPVLWLWIHCPVSPHLSSVDGKTDRHTWRGADSVAWPGPGEQLEGSQRRYIANEDLRGVHSKTAGSCVKGPQDIRSVGKMARPSLPLGPRV